MRFQNNALTKAFELVDKLIRKCYRLLNQVFCFGVFEPREALWGGGKKVNRDPFRHWFTHSVVNLTPDRYS